MDGWESGSEAGLELLGIAFCRCNSKSFKHMILGATGELSLKTILVVNGKLSGMTLGLSTKAILVAN